jgi:hypothetical protein
MDPSPRIIVIKESLTAFGCGLVGFVPIIGLIPAICALLCWRRVYFRHRQEWNPASAYLAAGTRLAVLGLLLSILLVCAVVLNSF